VSVTDVIWLLPALAGVALGLLLRPKGLPLLLALALLITCFILFGYSVDHYSNNNCQFGEPCPTGDQVIRIVNPIFFWLGAPLFLVAFGRNLWATWRDLRAWRRRRA
jgi:hypothetical protein